MNAVKKFRKRTLLTAASFFALSTVAGAVNAKDLYIQAQPLSSALMVLADKTNTTIVAPTKLTANKISAPVTGNVSPDEAIAQILVGSNLYFQKNSEGSYLVTTDTNGYRAINTSMTASETTSYEGNLSVYKEDTAFSEVIVDEIIVTAQKREQLLVDVPMAISVLGQQELAKRGVNNIQDLSFAVPGLTMSEVTGPGSYTIFLRGLANQTGSGALVALYLNEAPLSLSGYDQLSPEVFDIQRIEVLKGPQGTLYGQGSAGGTIRFIANQPVMNEFKGDIEAEGFSVAHGNAGGKISGILNIPLQTDTLAWRIAASYSGGGGWIDQPEADITDGNGTKLFNLRSILKWTPNDKLGINALIQLHRAETRLGLGYEEEDRTVEIGVDRSLALIPKEYNFTLYNLEVNYDFDFATFTSSTSYIDHDHLYPYSYIPLAGNFSYGLVEGYDERRQTSASQFSQEIRLSSSGETALEWTIGGFHTNADRNFIEDYVYIYDPEGDLYTSNNAAIYSGYYGSGGSSKTYSVFADISYAITDHLTVGGGIRYFYDKETYFSEYALDTGTLLAATFDSVDPRVYASYKYSDHSNLYVSFAKGFRSGGFNAEPFDPYDPEKAYTYEIGTKGEAMNGVLSYELAGYITKYKDLVRRSSVLVDGFFLQELSNVGRVNVHGLEAALTLRPSNNFTLTSVGSYIKSEIVETDAGDLVNIPGDRVDYTPEWSASLSANYTFNWSNNIPGYGRVDYNYRDKLTYTDRSGFMASALPQVSDSIHLVNMRLGATVNQVDLELYVQNLFDTNKAVDPYVGWTNSNRTRPRTIGMKIGYQF